MASILVVDDEMGIRELLNEILTDEGHTVYAAESAMQARTIREQMRPDLVLLDIWMPDVDGISLLKEWSKTGQLTMPVVMMSGHATIDTAVEATRIGAQAFLEKPITLQKLLKAVEQGLSRKPLGAASSKSGSGVIAHSLSGNGAGASAAQPQAVILSATQQTFELELPLRDARDAFERAYFEYHLAQESGSMTRVSEKTGLERTHLYRKLKQLGVDLSKPKRVA